MPVEFSISLSNTLKIDMVFCPSGSFFMGTDNEALYDAETMLPKHQVHLTQAFGISQTPITIQQYAWLKPNDYADQMKHPDAPLSTPTWFQAEGICLELNEKLKNTDLKIGNEMFVIGLDLKFDLPTEAQWEYACRADTQTDWYFGSTPSDINDYAWIATQDGSHFREALPDVKKKKPNAWGLYDMLGLVNEWCQDDRTFVDLTQFPAVRYDPVLKGESITVHGNTIPPRKIARGGDRSSKPQFCHVSYRSFVDPWNMFNDPVGIRLVLNKIS